MDEKFLLIAIGLGFYLWNSKGNNAVNEKYFEVPGVGPVPESELSVYGYRYFPPAGGFVHDTIIQQFLQAGGTEQSTYPGDGNQGGIPWDVLFQGAIDLIGVFANNNNNGQFEDQNNPGAGTYNDGTWVRTR